MHQGYIEPHACMVSIDDGGRVQIWVNNKAPFNLRSQLAAAWGMPEEQINLNPCSIGGDFGGKGSFMDAPLCYYLALHSKKPVKMVMDYIQELMAGNPRHPAAITLKTGVKKDGRLWARQARLVFNSGAYGAFKPRVYLGRADRSGGPYLIPHVSIDSYMVYTNNVPCGHMRAPAKPQVTFAVESHMDMVAREMGLDPYEFRLRNILHDGDVNPVGGSWQDIRAEETLRAGAVAADWSGAKTKPHWGRGMAISDQPSGTGQSAASVCMDGAGRATLRMSLWDTGTGAHTILRQVVAEELTIPVDDVSLEVRDTDAVPFDSGSGGSRVTYTSGQAALGAARDLLNKLIALAAELFDCPADRIRLESGRFLMEGDTPRILPMQEVAATAVSATQGPIVGEMTYTAPASRVTSFCTQVAEVEVDIETGVFSVNYFCRFRQLFLPVHLPFLTALLGHSGAVAGDVEFQDDRVVDHPVDGRSRGHWVGEDVLPLGEDQVGRDAQGPAFVAFGDEREEHLGLFGPLGQVPQVVQQQEVVVVELS